MPVLLFPFCLVARLGAISQRNEWKYCASRSPPSGFVQIGIEIFLLVADNNILSYLCRSKCRHTNCHLRCPFVRYRSEIHRINPFSNKFQGSLVLNVY